jgi:type IV pilus assembly protein PilE
MNNTNALLRSVPARRGSGGFTLIELMIVVAVIALLAAIAFPSYERQIIRSNRAVAKQFMLAIASKEEQYILDAREYTATIGSGGLGLTAPPEAANRYTFSTAVTATPPGYVITATAIGKQASDGDLTLDNLGTRSPADKWAN